MKKTGKPSRSSQLTAHTYATNKDFSSHEINIRLTEQMLKVVKTEEHLNNLIAQVKQTRQLLEAERAIQSGLQAILDLRH